MSQMPIRLSFAGLKVGFITHSSQYALRLDGFQLRDSSYFFWMHYYALLNSKPNFYYNQMQIKRRATQTVNWNDLSEMQDNLLMWEFEFNGQSIQSFRTLIQMLIWTVASNFGCDCEVRETSRKNFCNFEKYFTEKFGAELQPGCVESLN